MTGVRKIWRITKENKVLQQIFSQQLGLSKVTAQMLANRGITTTEEARHFLYGSVDQLPSPFDLKGMPEAVKRIERAISKGEPILVYGDYDVDGITSTVLLTEVLESLGAVCSYYIPHRLAEGYGLSLESLKKLSAQGTTLIITVDCGISSRDEVNWAREMGIDVIITDHHEPPAELPEAIAIINPKQPDCSYSFKELAGVGVTFKLAQALLRKEPDRAFEYLDLVAMGTIADIVPLKGENRILTKYGLPLISSGKRNGLKALLEVAGLADKEIDSGHVAFGLAPRLNAAGRMNHASEGVLLLREKDGETAKAIARALDRANRERQTIEAVIFEEALQIIEGNNLTRGKILVVAHPDWHLGVIGIVASKLVGRYCRPVILLSLEGGIAKGSARSIRGFNLFEALQACAEHLEKFGGHSQAAGLTLEASKLAEFSRAVGALAEDQISEEQMSEELRADGVVGFSDLTDSLYNQLSELAPFGCGNPTPLLVCRETDVIESRTVGGDGKHLKLRLRREGFTFDAIGFNLASFCEYVNFKERVDCMFELQINEWNGRTNMQLNLKDLKEYSVPDNPYESIGAQPDDQGDKDILAELFENAAEYLIDDYYRNVADKEEFFSKVVGVTFNNRQELIAALAEGDLLYLVREPQNPHDTNAVRVENKAAEQLGYLNARLARHFAPLLDKGEQYQVLVSGVTGGQGKNYGLNIVIQKIKRDDAEAQKARLTAIREQLKALGESELMEAIRAALLGPHCYRDSQLEALRSLEKGLNTLAIFGTGRGKSAVFQSFAARKAIRNDQLTVILYPLRALANDQFEVMAIKLTNLGLRVYKGNGSLGAGERAQLFAALDAGDVDILLTTPEFLSFHCEKLLRMPKEIGFFVVDESHHISIASSAHRPAYKRLAQLVERLGYPLTLAVTATANDDVAQEIINTLAIENMVVDPYVRVNMQLVDKRDVADKNAYVRDLVTSGGKTVIYVNSRSKSVELALMLREVHPNMAEKIAYYHAGLKNNHRQAIEKMFKEGSLQVIAATSAFGEGIDIPDIRHVVLYHLNFNFTEFNQQSGRGGRDGKTTQIHLLCGKRDVKINEFILDTTAPDRDFLATLYSVFKQLDKGQEGIRMTNKDIAEKLQKAGLRLAKDSSVSAALGILEELGLLRREALGRDRQIFLNPQPDKKIALEESLRFVEGQEEKQAFNEFNSTFFTATSAELIAAINQPIYPTGSLCLKTGTRGHN